MLSIDHKTYVRNERFCDVKYQHQIDIKLILDIDMDYLAIELDVNLVLPNLIYVQEINTRKVIFFMKTEVAH